jgi:hypothetical protein
MIGVWTPVELVPDGAERAGQMCEKPRQWWGLLVQRQRVEHLWLDHPPTRDAHQVQAIAGRGDGQIIHRNNIAVARTAMFSEWEEMGQVLGDTANVLRVGVGRWEGHLHLQGPLSGGGKRPVRLL